MLLLFPSAPALVLTPSPRDLMLLLRELPSPLTTSARDLLMLMPTTDTTMELIPMPMVPTLMLLLFLSAPALVLTPSPRDLMPSLRELPSPLTTSAKDLLMLMPTTDMPMELTPMPMELMPMVPTPTVPTPTASKSKENSVR